MWPFIGGLDSVPRAEFCKRREPITVSAIGLWLLALALTLVGHFISLPAERQKTRIPLAKRYTLFEL